MSELLRSWLRGMGTDIPCGPLEQTLANGYYFGHVLRRYGLQPDFHRFHNTLEPGEMAENYERLHTTFVTLGVPVSSHLTKRVMHGERGVASNLLNVLKQALDRHQRRRVMEDEEGMRNGLSREFCQTQRHRSVKDAFYATEARSFRDALDTAGDKRTRHHLTDLHKNQEVSQQKMTTPGNPGRRELGTVREALLSRQSKQDDRRLKLESVTAGDVVEEIRRFEEICGKCDESDALQRHPATSKEGLLHDASEYMNEITKRSVRKNRLDDAEAERSFVEKMHDACIQEEEKVLLNDLISALDRVSGKESAICQRLELMEAEEAMIKQNIAQRQRARRQQREADQAACVEREIAVWRQIKDDLKTRFQTLQATRKKTQQAVSEKQRSERLNDCRGIAWSLVRLVEVEREHRDLFGEGVIPRHVQQEWRRLFILDDDLLRIDRLQRERLPEDVVQSSVQSDVENYMSFREDWDLCTPIHHHGERISDARLAEWIGGLFFEHHRRNHSDGSSNLHDEIDKLQLRIAVTGPPCSGRQTISEGLRNAFGVEVLNPGDGRSCQDDDEEGEESSHPVLDQIRHLIYHRGDSAALHPGFVLVGYPSSQTTADDLERQLTGLDLESEKSLIEATSKLVPAPFEFLPDLNRTLTSGLDAVLLLTASDKEQMLERAIEKEKAKKSPPKKSQSKEATLPDQELEMLSRSIEEEWAQHQEQLDDLRSWLSKFDGLLVEIDASRTKEDVLRAAQTHVQRIVDAKEASRLSTETSQMAQSTLQDLAQTQAAAERILLSVQNIAQEMVATKKAELSAIESLGKNSNDKNKRPIQSEASRLLAETYLKAQKSSEELEAHVHCAQEDAAEIQRKTDELLSMVTAGDIHTSSREIIHSNYQSVLELGKKCQESCRKAQDIAILGAEYVEELAQIKSRNLDVQQASDLVSSIEEKNTLAPATFTEEESTDPPSNQEIQLASWQADSIESMHQLWKDLEESYFSELRIAFRATHEEQFYHLHRCKEAKLSFLDFLNRPDGKETSLISFVNDLNTVEMETEDEHDPRDAWISKCDALQTQLWGTCDDNASQQEKRLEELFHENAFQQELVCKIQRLHSNVIQTEVKKLLNVLKFCILYAVHVHGFEDIDVTQLLTLSSLDLSSSEVPAVLEKMLGSKPTVQFPEWIEETDERVAEIKITGERCVALLELVKKDFKCQSTADTQPGFAAQKEQSSKHPTDSDPRLSMVRDYTREVVEREIDITLSRAESVFRHLKSVLNEIDSCRSSTMDTCLKISAERHRQHCTSVGILIESIKARIKNGEAIDATQLQLKDDGTWLLNTTKSPAASDAGDRWRPEDAVFAELTDEQFPLLVQEFKAIGDGDVVRIEAATTAIYRVCVCCTSPSHPAYFPATEQTPPDTDSDTRHHSRSLSDITRFVSHFDKDNNGYVNWKRLLIHLAIAHVNKQNSRPSALPVRETCEDSEAEGSTGVAPSDTAISEPEKQCWNHPPSAAKHSLVQFLGQLSLEPFLIQQDCADLTHALSLLGCTPNEHTPVLIT